MHSNIKQKARRCLPRGVPFVLLLWTASLTAAADTAIIGVIVDGPAQREVIPLDVVKSETRALIGDEFEVAFPEDKFLDGNWTVAGIKAAAQKLLRDPQVDIILANGLVSAHILATQAQLVKPAIATVVADPVLQKLPMNGDSSGKKTWYIWPTIIPLVPI